MKRFLSFFMVFLLFACVDSGLEPAASKVVPPGEDFSLQFGDAAIIEGTNLTVKFSDVGSDSRCPVDVICIWAGNADVRLEISGLDSLVTVVVNTTLDPPSVTVGGYTITLKQLNPYPLSTRHIEKKDYIATLKVTAPVR